MPNYPARTITLAQLKINGNKGFAEPLCNTCKARDCENPIEKREVVVTGIAKKMRVWVSGNRVAFVADCEGYCP